MRFDERNRGGVARATQQWCSAQLRNRVLWYRGRVGEGDGDLTILLRGLDRLIGRAVAAAKWLALPLITLLFLQWPLRDLFRGYSREANDLGQVAFAFFVALSVTAATRARTHLAADLLARQYSARTRQCLDRLGAAAGLLPWALFVLMASKGTVVSSIRDVESFQDSGNPGYFLIKVALWVMAAAILGQSLVDIFRTGKADDK
ncbi:MAG: TRAP transporter small permease subunit [Alphaproteobacteria bacterium]|nr:MAG: TRAP transporter small permease subunit [Alphaproteobacteria bacterium]